MPEEDQELARPNRQTLCVVPHDGERTYQCMTHLGINLSKLLSKEGGDSI